MRAMRRLVLLGVGAAALAGLILVACQTYDFEQVTPKAVTAVIQHEPIIGQQKPPKIMLVIDKSGSMKTTPDSDNNWGCCQTVDKNNLCTGYSAAGDCKWNSLKSLLIDPGKFLDSTNTTTRIGLAVFPDRTADSSGNACVEGQILVPVPDQAGTSVAAIKDQFSGANMLVPGGGTPTAAMLLKVLGDATFMADEASTKRYAILITDGYPNCNGDLDGTTCKCTAGDCSTYPQSCLDDDRMVGAVDSLHGQGVNTFVIGFGSGTSSGMAKDTLNSAAEKGGQATSNPDGSEFYQANNAADLQKILDTIKQLIQQCDFSLTQAAQSQNVLEVVVADSSDGSRTTLTQCQDASGALLLCGACPSTSTADWCFNDAGLTSVEIRGKWCDTIKSATDDRYVVDFALVKEL
jgi:hypothetical protein